MKRQTKVTPDYIRYEVRNLEECDFERIEKLSPKDITKHYWEIKQQILGEKIEWEIDVRKFLTNLDNIEIDLSKDFKWRKRLA